MRRSTILLSFIFSVTAIAQDWRIYNVANGALPDDHVYAVAIDSSGNVWAGTWGGVAVRRGTEWTQYTPANSGLPSPFVRSIAIANDGSTWIGTIGGGAARFDGATWTVYNHANSGLTNDAVHAIAFDSAENVWFATDSGAARLSGETWTLYNYQNSDIAGNLVRTISFSGDGRIWFGIHEPQYVRGYLNSFDGVNWGLYSFNQMGVPTSFVNGVLIDDAGERWVATGGGLLVSQQTGWQWYTRQNSGLPSSGVTSIIEDERGRKWIGTGGGVAQLRGATWTAYTTHNSGLPSDFVWALAADAQDNIWIGTVGGGLAMLSPTTSTDEDERKPEHFSLEQNYPNPFNPSTRIEFKLWQTGLTTLTIVDVLGREVSVLVNEELNAGRHSVLFDAGNLASGVYHFVLRSGSQTEARNMLLLR